MKYMKLTRTFLVLFVIVGCNQNSNEDDLSINKDYSNNKDYIEEKENFKKYENKDLYNKKNLDDNQKTQKKQSKEVQKKILDVPIIKQNPELKYGCEVTSLTMLLQYAGYNVTKIELANKLPKENDPPIKSNSGDIIRWGDPNEGFVGDVTGKKAGYAVFDKPLEDLMRQYLGDKTLNLTGESFNRLLEQIDKDKPVVVWTTGDYKLPDRWESWKHGTEKIKTPLDLHAVVLVGYDQNNVYVNDPLSGVKGQRINSKTFISSWDALKKRALSYE